MSDLKTDEEKAEEIKQWWKENGTSVIVGVSLAVVGVFGWNQWKQHQITQSEEASALFAKVQNTPDVINQLKSDYSSTPYASLASLTAAKTAAEKGEDDKAITELKWVIDNTPDDDVRDVANLRLARLYVANGKTAEAESIISGTFAKPYEALVFELKGDIYSAKQDLKKAAEAYDEAIKLSGGPAPQYLQMKRNNIGEGS